MAEKKITRKVITKAVATKEKEETSKVEQPKNLKSRRGCFFCESKTNPIYTDMAVLRRFITDRVKIVSRDKNNLCSKHQRAVSRNIKYARHLALLPFVPKV